MKKYLFIISVALLFSLCTVTCYAVNITAEATETVDVCITVSHTPAEGVVTAEEANGVYVAEVGEELVITVKPQSQASDCSLVVYPIPETAAEAYGWLEACCESFGKDLLYYDIYFVDASGNRVDCGEFTVTVSMPDDSGTVKTAALDTEGVLTALENTVNGNTVTFTMTGNGYCVLASEAEAEDSPLPPTGDKGTATLILLLIASLVTACALVRRKRA